MIGMQFACIFGSIVMARLYRRLASVTRSQRCTRDLIHLLIEQLADANSQSLTELSEFCRTELPTKVEVMVQNIDRHIKDNKNAATKYVDEITPGTHTRSAIFGKLIQRQPRLASGVSWPTVLSMRA
ncbi:MAG: hypothetical protein FD138_3024 [Planctomycetota bacterium]|nr:MAG: hypothetical protein FD138_3024 [Planctomycetota bacterium]